MEKTAKVIRYITVAPVLAGITLILLYFFRTDIFESAAALLISLFFLTILPLLAYPLQRFIPPYKDRGRDGQRSLAMLFAVGGYILGSVYCLIARTGIGLWIIYLEYLLSGAVILILNKAFHLKASGHACGSAGPVALLVYFGIPALLPGLLILALTFWASLITKRHTSWQFLGGTVVSVAVLLLLRVIFGIA